MLKELYVEKGIVVRNLPSNSKKDCVQKKVCRKFRKISKRIVLELALKTLKGLYIEKGMQKIIVCRNCSKTLKGLYVEEGMQKIIVCRKCSKNSKRIVCRRRYVENYCMQKML